MATVIWALIRTALKGYFDSRPSVYMGKKHNIIISGNIGAGKTTLCEEL
jgi:tRNA A37 threonylcarbamoyladenosine biosynthesis protein TsaE